VHPGADLELLITSRHPIVAVDTFEEERLEELCRDIAGRLDLPLFIWTVTGGLVRAVGQERVANTSQPGAALAQLLSAPARGLYFFKDLHHYLQDPVIIRQLIDLTRTFGGAYRTLLFPAPVSEIPQDLKHLVACYRLELPGTEDLKLLARRTIKELCRDHNIRIDLTAEELTRLVDSLRGLTAFEAERALSQAILRDFALTRDDLPFLAGVKKEIPQKDGLLDFYPRETSMAETGGLQNLKSWVAKRRRGFTQEARDFGLDPPKGIMLLGVQGCGKSLSATAVAREWELPLLKLEPGRLYDKFVGESERNLEGALSIAERMAPAVLWIDEIEKGFASVSSSEADAGLSKRIFGRLLGWLQDKPAPVFVAATCNAVETLPPEMIRKGRFDEIFFIDLPGPQQRADILAIHLRKRKRDPAGFDLGSLAAAADGFSGAELEQAVVSALYSAFSGGEALTTSELLAEISQTRPLSVTRREDIQALREWARGRTVPAG